MNYWTQSKSNIFVAAHWVLEILRAKGLHK